MAEQEEKIVRPVTTERLVEIEKRGRVTPDRPITTQTTQAPAPTPTSDEG
jgi:hypothetical protein